MIVENENLQFDIIGSLLIRMPALCDLLLREELHALETRVKMEDCVSTKAAATFVFVLANLAEKLATVRDYCNFTNWRCELSFDNFDGQQFNLSRNGFKSIRVGGKKKKTQRAEKNTVLEYAFPDPDKMNAHTSELHDKFPLQWIKF